MLKTTIVSRNKHRDPYEIRLKLLQYLEEKPFKTVAMSAATFIMETSSRQGFALLAQMEEEGLIEIHKPDRPSFVRGVVTITAKGLEVGGMLTQIIGMCSKRGEYLH